MAEMEAHSRPAETGPVADCPVSARAVAKADLLLTTPLLTFWSDDMQ